jgi:hypothetical protein
MSPAIADISNRWPGDRTCFQAFRKRAIILAKPVCWVGNNLGASIIKLEPLD